MTEIEELRAENRRLRAELAHLWQLLEIGEHPIRARILVWLGARPNGSPIQFVKDLNNDQWTVSAVAYHFRKLLGERRIRLSRTRPVRGASEHFYALNRKKPPPAEPKPKKGRSK